MCRLHRYRFSFRGLQPVFQHLVTEYSILKMLPTQKHVARDVDRVLSSVVLRVQSVLAQTDPKALPGLSHEDQITLSLGTWRDCLGETPSRDLKIAFRAIQPVLKHPSS